MSKEKTKREEFVEDLEGILGKGNELVIESIADAAEAVYGSGGGTGKFKHVPPIWEKLRQKLKER